MKNLGKINTVSWCFRFSYNTDKDG